MAEAESVRSALAHYERAFREAPSQPLTPRDLIMQGGVASGVVYPLAIMEIASKHRLHGVGGTSAGAIGAVVAAAAEYGRSRGARSYAQFVTLSEELLESGIARFFQPSFWMGAPFDLLVGLQSRGPVAGLLAYLATRWPFFLFAGAVGIVSVGWPAAGSPDILPPTGDTLQMAIPAILAYIATAAIGAPFWFYKVTAARKRDRFDWLLAVILVAGLATSATLLFNSINKSFAGMEFWSRQIGHLTLTLVSVLPAFIATAAFLLCVDLWRLRRFEHSFGLCAGANRRNPEAKPALMDWLHGHVQAAAGKPLDRPLTFGDLEPTRKNAAANAAPLDSDDIELRMTVTDLGQRRPHTLPFLPEGLLFKPNDLLKVLPRAVVESMWDGTQPGKLHPLPAWYDLPVLLAVRMSLCYPVLFRMVPLYQRVDDGTPRRVLFTDGGICSNFPIHFYDGLLPRWPTLAIALGDSDDKDVGHVAIDRSLDASEPQKAPRALGEALGRIFLTAGGWRDQVQTSLPGYRERVCVVKLTKAQGGFNFDMAPAAVESAMALGRDAGRLLSGEPVPGAGPPFDEGEHRYRRFLVSFARLEETLDALAVTWADQTLDWTTFLRNHTSKEFPQTGAKSNAVAQAVARIDALAPHLKAADPPLRTQYDVPQPPTNLRVTPRE